jgi:hypothetical protein
MLICWYLQCLGNLQPEVDSDYKWAMNMVAMVALCFKLMPKQNVDKIS